MEIFFVLRKVIRKFQPPKDGAKSPSIDGWERFENRWCGIYNMQLSPMKDVSDYHAIIFYHYI